MERESRTIPGLPPQHLSRRRLQERLAEWAPITVVRGPQGYGKTTLVAGWLSEQPDDEVSVVWLTLQDGQGEPDRFLGLLVQQLRAAGLLFGANLASATDSLALLAEALPAPTAPQRLALVIDNAHLLTDGAILGEMIALVQRHVDLHVVLISRTRHPIETSAAGFVVVNALRPRELAMTIGEIEQFATVLGSPLDRAGALPVEAAVGGWIAAVQLVIRHAEHGQPALIAAREYIRDAVAPLFDDEAVMRELMPFTLADELDFELIRALGGDENPDDLIRRIEADGLTDRRYRGDRVVLVLPSLIREVLRETFAHRDPEAAVAFHRQLAHWYHSQAGETAQLDALEHAVAGHDWGLAHSVWAAYGTSLSLRHLDRLRFALAQIPEDVMLRYPGTHVARFVLDSLASDNDTDARSATARTYFEASSREVNDHRDRLPLADLLYVSTGHVLGLRMRGQLRAAIDFGAEVEPRIAELTTTGHELHDRLGLFHLQRAFTQTVIGDDESAIRSYQRAWEYRTGGQADFIPANVAANLAMTYTLGGQIRKAELWVARFQGYQLQGTWAEYLTGIGARIASAYMCVDRLDEEGAASWLEQLGEGSAASELWAFTAAAHAQRGLHFEDPATALANLDYAQAAHESPPSEGAAARLLMRARADLLIAAGYGQRAQYLLSAHPSQSPTLAVPLARIQVLSGEYANARSIAAEATAGKHVPPRDRLELLLLKALAAVRMGDRVDASVLMRHALDIFQASKMLRVLATVPADAREDLLALAPFELTPDQLARLRAQPEVYPERLTIITLTKREQSLLIALETTASRQRIAASLYVSLNTVKTQMAGLYRKLNTATREDTLMRARQLGLLSGENHGRSGFG